MFEIYFKFLEITIQMSRWYQLCIKVSVSYIYWTLNHLLYQSICALIFNFEVIFLDFSFHLLMSFLHPKET